MTPHSQEYIITEENLQEVFEHADWGMTNFRKFKDKLRPYTAASGWEQVLNELKEIIDGAISGLYKGTEDAVSAHARHKALSWVDMKISELRKRGEQR